LDYISFKMASGLVKRLELEMRGRPAEQILDLNLDNCRAKKIEGLTSDFVNLQTLSLINLGLQSLEGFPKLGNLRKLELSDNSISSGLDGLACCPNITHLSLSGNKIKDLVILEPLKDLTHLKSLDLFNCEVTNLEGYREKVFDILKQLVFLDGFDKEEQEQEDVDGEEDDNDDDDDNEVDEEGSDGSDDDDDDEEDEDEDEEDYDPDAVDSDDDVAEVDDKVVQQVEDVEDSDDDDDDVVEGGDDDDDDDDDDEEGEDDEEADADDSTSRGTKRKHDDEVEKSDDEEDA